MIFFQISSKPLKSNFLQRFFIILLKCPSLLFWCPTRFFSNLYLSKIFIYFSKTVCMHFHKFRPKSITLKNFSAAHSDFFSLIKVAVTICDNKLWNRLIRAKCLKEAERQQKDSSFHDRSDYSWHIYIH